MLGGGRTMEMDCASVDWNERLKPESQKEKRTVEEK
jgi:hypothetical protein